VENKCAHDILRNLMIGPPEHWPQYRENTASFRLLYDSMTEELSKYAGGLPARNEREWFQELIEGFEREFEAWERNLRLRRCLERIAGVRTQALRVIGHAYIHIGYDLPRVIADSFSHRQAHEVSRLQECYLDATNVVRETFEAAATKRSIFGGYGPVFWIVRRAPIVRYLDLGAWAIRLRERSWDAAERLRDSPNRHADEAEMWREVEAKLRSATEHWNPLRWIYELRDPPRLPLARSPSPQMQVIPYVTDVREDDD